MRVAQVLYSFKIGGSETVGRDLALGLTRRGETCGVCALEADGVIRRELMDEGIDAFLISRKSGELLGPVRRLRGMIREFRPDVVHTHHLHELVYALLPARLAGIPVVHTEHETLSLRSAKARNRLRLLARWCRFVTGVSEDISHFLERDVRIPGHKVRTIGNGIDLVRYSPPQDGPAALPEGSPVTLGAVARLDPLKDHATLLKALSQVVEVIPGVRILLVGEGGLRDDLESLAADLGIQDHVHFLGARRDVAELLRTMDVFVLSSRSEGLPVAVLEAMASGSVVVATRVGSVPQVVRHGETGFLVEPGDGAALASRLVEVIRSLPELSAVRSAARSLIRERYDFERTLDAYLDLYRQCIQRR